MKRKGVRTIQIFVQTILMSSAIKSMYYIYGLVLPKMVHVDKFIS